AFGIVIVRGIEVTRLVPWHLRAVECNQRHSFDFSCVTFCCLSRAVRRCVLVARRGLPLADWRKRREWGGKEWNKHNPVSYLAHGRVRKSMAMLDKRGEQLRSLGEPLQAYQNIEHYFNLFCGVVNGVRSPQRGGQLQRSVQRLRAVMPGADH